MSFTLNEVKCGICKEFPEIPLNCYYCNNLFCKGCFDNEKFKQKNKCPSCSKILNFIPNEALREIIYSTMVECEKCKETMSQKDLLKHKEEVCRVFKCKLCDGNFENFNEFFMHLKEQIHKNIIITKFNKKKEGANYLEEFKDQIKLLNETRKKLEELNYIINSKKKEESKEIERYEDSNTIHKFLNLIGRIEKNSESILDNENKDDLFSSIQIPIIPKTECYLDNFMDLFFCKKKTTFQCNCEYKFCAPTCCMCKECMTINQEYHKLNEYHLINKAGRTAFCKDGKFHCLYQYQAKEEKNNNFFINKRICKPESICDACIDLNINASKYLSQDILQELNFVEYNKEENKEEKKEQ